MDGHRTLVCGTCNCEQALSSDADAEFAIWPGCRQKFSADEAFRMVESALRDCRRDIENLMATLVRGIPSDIFE